MAVELTKSVIAATMDTVLDDATQTVAGVSGFVKTGEGLPTLSTTLTNGTGNQQGNQAYAQLYTIAAGANADIDLNSGSILGLVNAVASFTKIKKIVVAIKDHDGTKKVRVGPQGVTNGAQLWFGGTGATCYEEVVEWTVKVNSYGGWTVTAGTGDILRINNPTAGSVDVYIAIVGLS